MRAARTAVFTALVAGAAAACGASARTTAAAADTAAIRSQVDSTMRAHFAAFEQGHLASWARVLAEDVVFTAADMAVVLHRDSVLAKMQRDFAPAGGDLRVAIKPDSGRVWVQADGRTAGATYGLDYAVTYQGKTYPVHLRAAYLLARDSADWRAVAVQYSRPIAYDSLFLALLSRRIPGAARLGGDVPPAAGEIARQFRGDIRDIRTATFAPGAVVASPGGVVGGRAAAAELAQWLGPPGNATEPGDGLRGGLSSRGTIGWVASNLHVPIFAGPESAIAPIRALFVYRLVENRWEIIQASLSVPQRGL